MWYLALLISFGGFEQVWWAYLLSHLISAGGLSCTHYLVLQANMSDSKGTMHSAVLMTYCSLVINHVWICLISLAPIPPLLQLSCPKFFIIKFNKYLLQSPVDKLEYFTVLVLKLKLHNQYKLKVFKLCVPGAIWKTTNARNGFRWESRCGPQAMNPKFGISITVTPI